MRLLLLCAINSNKPLQYSRLPIGFGYLASYLKLHKPDVQTFVVGTDVDGVGTALARYQPDVVGISCVSENYNRAKRVAAICKAKGLPVMIGGSHISDIPTNLSPDMDVGVMGEGEQTLLELLQLMGSRGWSISDLRQVKGIVFWNEGRELEFTGEHPRIENLDVLPPPDRRLLNFARGAVIPIFSSRGCPYDCVFCSSSRFWRRIRYHSPEYVASEIENIIKTFNPVHITFDDDLFIAKRDRLAEMAELFEERGFTKRVHFTASSRANLVDERVVELLRRMSFYSLYMGLESGNEPTLRFLKGGAVSVEINERAVQIFHEAGLRPRGTFIIGAPQETKAQILETLDFIRRVPLYDFAVYILAPLPGTPLWEYAKQRGLVSDDMDWDRLNFEQVRDDSLVLSETLSLGELNGLMELFNEERKRKLRQHQKERAMFLVKTALRRPDHIPQYFAGRAKGLLQSLKTKS